MFYGDTVQDTRSFFFLSWQKYQEKKPVSALEQQLIDVIIIHPEYHSILENEEISLYKEYHPDIDDHNPFLHMGLHLAIRDQIASNKPSGITDIFQKLLKKHQDSHIVEHLIMECLGEQIWRMQKNQTDFDLKAYIRACKNIK